MSTLVVTKRSHFEIRDVRGWTSNNEYAVVTTNNGVEHLLTMPEFKQFKDAWFREHGQ